MRNLTLSWVLLLWYPTNEMMIRVVLRYFYWWRVLNACYLKRICACLCETALSVCLYAHLPVWERTEAKSKNLCIIFHIVKKARHTLRECLPQRRWQGRRKIGNISGGKCVLEKKWLLYLLYDWTMNNYHYLMGTLINVDSRIPSICLLFYSPSFLF